MPYKNYALYLSYKKNLTHILIQIRYYDFHKTFAHNKLRYEMITLRKSQDRGTTKRDWLDSRHSFSFGDYQDPHWKSFKNLRVINEDIIQPGKGFPAHFHKDMEIITYIVDGKLQHKDSIGGGSIIHAGEVQKMSAGSGIMHSEFNPSCEETVHLLQIWIIPEKENLPPQYEQKTFPWSTTQNKLILIGSPDGRENSITIHQDVNLYGASLTKGAELQFPLREERGAWIQIIKGNLHVNAQTLSKGDGAQIFDEPLIHITCLEFSEFLLFDLGES